MNETKFEIFYRLLNDDGRAPWQPAGTLDGLVWNGTMQLRITGDAAPLALPFELGNEDILILAVKEHSHDIMNTANSIIAQTLTRVDRTTGNVFVYSRSRRTVAGKQLWSEWDALNGATTAMLQDGSVTTPKLAADVREKVDNPLRPLFIAAGAEYNDSGADKTKTAPWGETVTHKAGHYYLNGLGDITEEQMMEIYKYTFPLLGSTDWTNALRGVNVRTNFFYPFFYATQKIKSLKAAFNTNSFIEVICFNSSGIYSIKVSLSEPSFWDYAFVKCNNLKRIIGTLDISPISAQSMKYFGYDCESLIDVRLYGLKGNLDLLNKSSNINKESVVYVVQNAIPSSAITIKLQQDAYARLVDDADVISALEAQPLVSLVSA